MEITAVNGIVVTQEIIIILTMPRFNVGKPRASPTPITEPTKVCVVEIGSPNLEHIKTTEAAPKVAQNPLEGVISVIFSPTVAITRYPQTIKPKTMNPPPSPSIQVGIATFISTAPPSKIETTAAKGPTALATSLDPWAKAI